MTDDCTVGDKEYQKLFKHSKETGRSGKYLEQTKDDMQLHGTMTNDVHAVFTLEVEYITPTKPALVPFGKVFSTISNFM